VVGGGVLGFRVMRGWVGDGVLWVVGGCVCYCWVNVGGNVGVGVLSST